MCSIRDFISGHGSFYCDCKKIPVCLVFPPHIIDPQVVLIYLYSSTSVFPAHIIDPQVILIYL